MLFADITGFTRLVEKLDDEQAYAIVTGCLRILDAVARKHGGSVDKYLGDCVMAVFGVPTAIESAPKAAVNAAIEMRTRVDEYNREHPEAPPLTVHSGIETGPVISGDVSGPVLREFAVLGDAVNVASRLKDLAPPGSIYVGSETHRYTKDEFEYRPLSELPLKGKVARVAAWEVLSSSTRLYRPEPVAGRSLFPEVVGRDAEIARLREAVRRVAAGRGGLMGLVGEAGLGKSRLLAELAAAEETRAVSWLRGRSLSIGRSLSFHPFADLLRTWAGIGDDDDDWLRPLESAVASRLPDEADQIVPVLATVMGLRLPPELRRRIQGIQSLQGEALERLVLRSVTELLREASRERPLVLVFEDLHWADLSSIGLLESLLRLVETHPILFLLACRPHFASTSLRILDAARSRHADRYDEVVLEPLGRDAARRLVADLFRGGELPRELHDALRAKAAGNPFFIEEVVRSLLDSGALVRRDGSLAATEKIRTAFVPPTVQEVIMTRIDALEPRRRNVLQVASLMGTSFHVPVLVEVLDKNELEEDLRELTELGFLAREEAYEGTRYAFQHPLIQEVAYGSILRARREELHLAIAEAIESVLTENVPGYLAMLAYHFSLGRDPERAEHYLFRAGDEAASAAASNEALHFFEEASKLYVRIHGEGGDPAKKSLLERKVALAFLNRGQLLEAVDHFDEALQHLGERVPRGRMELAPRFAWDLGSILARLYLPRRRARPPATPVQREVVDLMFRRAIAQSTAAPARFLADSLATLHQLSRVDPRSVPEAGAMYAGAVAIFSFGGISFDVSRRLLALAGELAEQGGVRELLLYYRLLVFLHHLLAGDWSETHAIPEELLDEGLRGGRLWEVATYLNFDGVRRIYQGEFAKARRRIDELARIADLYQHELAASAQHALLAYLHLERRELGEALRAVTSYYESHSEVLFHLLAHGTRAKIELLGREEAAAEASLARADELRARAGRVAPYHGVGCLAARYALDLARLESACGSGAAAELRRRRRYAARSRRPALRAAARVAWRRPEVLRLAGRHAWLLGRREEALRRWWQSVELAERLGSRPELARTCHELALRLAEPGASRLRSEGEASELRERARGIYEELGLAWDLERLASATPP